MTAAIITLTFLLAAWAIGVAVLTVLEDSGNKMVAALAGRSLKSCEFGQERQVTVWLSPRFLKARPVAMWAMAAPSSIEWRAAA